MPDGCGSRMTAILKSKPRIARSLSSGRWRIKSAMRASAHRSAPTTVYTAPQFDRHGGLSERLSAQQGAFISVFDPTYDARVLDAVQHRRPKPSLASTVSRSTRPAVSISRAVSAHRRTLPQPRAPSSRPMATAFPTPSCEDRGVRVDGTGCPDRLSRRRKSRLHRVPSCDGYWYSLDGTGHSLGARGVRRRIFR